MKRWDWTLPPGAISGHNETREWLSLSLIGHLD